jgi:hypothetical protein
MFPFGRDAPDRLLHNGPSTIENNKVRNSTDVETGSQLRMSLRVHFQDDRISGHVRSRA